MRVLVVAGCGNIGSHLIPLLGRVASGCRFVLVDPDAYGQENHANQAIRREDAGKAKVMVQARVLRRLQDSPRVAACRARLEDLPVGLLRGAILLTCVDNVPARIYANQMVWRLRIPWIDAGVEAGGLLARVSCFLPGEGLACMECGFDEARYGSLEWRYPCGGVAPEDRKAKPPAALGSLAASLQALECLKFLNGDPGSFAPGRQIVHSAQWQRHYVTHLERSPTCRFDHAAWEIREIGAGPGGLTVRQALGFGGERAPGLRVEGSPFARALTCTACSRRWERLKLVASLNAGDRRCPGCGGEGQVSGWDLLEWLEPERFPGVERKMLRSLGVRGGDVLALAGDPSGVRYLLSSGMERAI